MEEQTTQTPKEKSSLRKKILKIALIVIAVLAVILLLVLWQIDRIVATSTRTVGSALTGTRVDTSGVSIKPLAGAVKITGFEVGNPENFHKERAIQIDTFHVDVDMGSVFTDKIEIEYLELSGVEINYEYILGRGSNLDIILKNVEKNTGADKKTAEQKPEKSSAQSEKATQEDKTQKQLVIRKLILKDIKVTVSAKALKSSLIIPMIPIEMENVGEGKDLAGTISEVLSRIITEIANVVDFNKIGQSLSDAGKGVAQGIDSAVGTIGDSLVSVGDSAGGAVQDTLDKSVKMIKSLPGFGK